MTHLHRKPEEAAIGHDSLSDNKQGIDSLSTVPLSGALNGRSTHSSSSMARLRRHKKWSGSRKSPRATRNTPSSSSPRHWRSAATDHSGSTTHSSLQSVGTPRRSLSSPVRESGRESTTPQSVATSSSSRRSLSTWSNSRRSLRRIPSGRRVTTPTRTASLENSLHHPPPPPPPPPQTPQSALGESITDFSYTEHTYYSEGDYVLDQTDRDNIDDNDSSNDDEDDDDDIDDNGSDSVGWDSDSGVPYTLHRANSRMSLDAETLSSAFTLNDLASVDSVSSLEVEDDYHPNVVDLQQLDTTDDPTTNNNKLADPNSSRSRHLALPPLELVDTVDDISLDSGEREQRRLHKHMDVHELREVFCHSRSLQQQQQQGSSSLPETGQDHAVSVRGPLINVDEVEEFLDEDEDVAMQRTIARMHKSFAISGFAVKTSKDDDDDEYEEEEVVAHTDAATQGRGRMRRNSFDDGTYSYHNATDAPTDLAAAKHFLAGLASSAPGLGERTKPKQDDQVHHHLRVDSKGSIASSEYTEVVSSVDGEILSDGDDDDDNQMDDANERTLSHSQSNGKPNVCVSPLPGANSKLVPNGGGDTSSGPLPRGNASSDSSDFEEVVVQQSEDNDYEEDTIEENLDEECIHSRL